MAELVRGRYESFDTEIGAQIEVWDMLPINSSLCFFLLSFDFLLELMQKNNGPQQAGEANFELLEKKAIEWGEPNVPSAKQVIKLFHSFFFIWIKCFSNHKISTTSDSHIVISSILSLWNPSSLSLWLACVSYQFKIKIEHIDEQ